MTLDNVQGRTNYGFAENPCVNVIHCVGLVMVE